MPHVTSHSPSEREACDAKRQPPQVTHLYAVYESVATCASVSDHWGILIRAARSGRLATFQTSITVARVHAQHNGRGKQPARVPLPSGKMIKVSEGTLKTYGGRFQEASIVMLGSGRPRSPCCHLRCTHFFCPLSKLYVMSAAHRTALAAMNASREDETAYCRGLRCCRTASLFYNFRRRTSGAKTAVDVS